MYHESVAGRGVGKGGKGVAHSETSFPCASCPAREWPEPADCRSSIPCTPRRSSGGWTSMPAAGNTGVSRKLHATLEGATRGIWL